MLPPLAHIENYQRALLRGIAQPLNAEVSSSEVVDWAPSTAHLRAVQKAQNENRLRASIFASFAGEFFCFCFCFLTLQFLQVTTFITIIVHTLQHFL